MNRKLNIFITYYGGRIFYFYFGIKIFSLVKFKYVGLGEMVMGYFNLYFLVIRFLGNVLVIYSV